MGEEEVDRYVTFLESRQIDLPNGGKGFEDMEGIRTAVWYDALEMMDLYREKIEIGRQEG